MMPKTIQTMAWAYEQICKGDDPWTALGNFTNAWYGYAKDIRTTLVHEPLMKLKQDTEHTHQWAAFCAASVEFLCDCYGISCPVWAYDPYYILTAPWWHTKRIHDTALKERLMQSTPIPFARRNIFCGNRLFQNKYEMSDWVQEAHAKGITNPSDIWHYARQKEISVHGA